jgi:hypothetical protein
VPVTPGEAAAYLKTNAARWFRDSDDGPEGTAHDPFEPVPGHDGLLRIRKRADGACGFLSPTGLCRIHEELGVDRKPLACRVFPFRFHPIEGDVVATASFACPTVVANEGTLLSKQVAEIQALYLDWQHEQPETPAAVEFLAGYALPPPILAKLRRLLTRILDMPGPDGAFDLAASLRRVARFTADFSRRQVLGLPPGDLEEYFDVMSRHALTPGGAPPPRRAPALTRLVFRGFLLSALSVQLHLDPVFSGRPWAVRLALFRLLAHLHGVGPGAAGFDLGAARLVTLDPRDDAIREIATHYLRSTFETIGTGRRPIVDEIAMAAAHLNAACVLARMDAARRGLTRVDAASFTHGILTSADLAQGDDGGRLSWLLTIFAGGLEALYLFPPP